MAGPAPLPVVLLVELKHVDSYHVLSDATQRQGLRGAPAGLRAGRVPGWRRLGGAAELVARALPRRTAAARGPQGPEQEAAGQAGGHRGLLLRAAGRRAERRRFGRCLRLALSRTAPPHGDEGVVGVASPRC